MKSTEANTRVDKAKIIVPNTGVNKAIKPDIATTKVLKEKRGAITVEAAIVMPLFLCLLFTLAFLIRAVYTYELVQHALTKTSNEIASLSYLYYKSGLLEIDKMQYEYPSGPSQVDEELNQASDVLDVQLDVLQTIMRVLGQRNSDNNLNTPISEGIGSILEQFTKLMPADLVGELKNGTFTLLAKNLMEKYIEAGSELDADERLKILGIEGGMNGLDLSPSAFFEEENEIDLIVKYSIKLPLPIKLTDDFTVVQRAYATAWVGGDDPKKRLKLDVSALENSIWSLPNFDRGRKFREIYGANLPFNFPVIAYYQAGTARMIKSMDLTAPSYADSAQIQKILEGYIYELQIYEGQAVAWGNSNIVIPPEEIQKKELLLIIPKDELSEAAERVLQICSRKAQGLGIDLDIVKYGYSTRQQE